MNNIKNYYLRKLLWTYVEACFNSHLPQYDLSQKLRKRYNFISVNLYGYEFNIYLAVRICSYFTIFFFICVLKQHNLQSSAIHKYYSNINNIWTTLCNRKLFTIVYLFIYSEKLKESTFFYTIYPPSWLFVNILLCCGYVIHSIHILKLRSLRKLAPIITILVMNVVIAISHHTTLLIL